MFRAAPLPAARGRHHAVGAGLVAALHDGDVGPVGVVALRVGRIEGLAGFQAQPRDPAVAALQFGDEFRQAAVARRTTHQADVRRALEDPQSLLLGHAAQHAEHPAVGRSLKLLQTAVDLLLGFVADAAGVVQHQVGVVRAGGFGIAHGDERAGDSLGVVDIHLAAERLDVEPLHQIRPSPIRRFYPCPRRMAQPMANNARTNQPKHRRP